MFSFTHSCVFKLFFHSILFLQTHKYKPKDTDNLVLGFGFFFPLMFWWQSGCCKPPSSCGYTFINATNWQETTPPPSASAKDPDCALWSNAPTELCFNCTSCKAGVLQDLKQDWRKVAIANIIMLVFLIATYSIGCCAFRNNRRDGGGGFFNGGRYGKQSHKF